MIADVRLKLKMRIRALFDHLLDLAGDERDWRIYLDGVTVPCGHGSDWRCILAAIVSRELPGTTVHVGQFTVELDLPLLYKGSERTLRVQISARVRSLMVAQSTPEGMRERKFLSCPTVRADVRPITGISQRKRTR